MRMQTSFPVKLTCTQMFLFQEKASIDPVCRPILFQLFTKSCFRVVSYGDLCAAPSRSRTQMRKRRASRYLCKVMKMMLCYLYIRSEVTALL